MAPGRQYYVLDQSFEDDFTRPNGETSLFLAVPVLEHGRAGGPGLSMGAPLIQFNRLRWGRLPCCATGERGEEDLRSEHVLMGEADVINHEELKNDIS